MGLGIVFEGMQRRLYAGQRMSVEEIPEKQDDIDRLWCQIMIPSNDLVMDHRSSCAAPAPLFARRIGCLKKHRRSTATAIPLHPFMEPVRDRFPPISRVGVGHDRVSRSMKFQDRHRPTGVTATGGRIKGPCHSAKRSNALGQFTREQTDHPTTIRVARSVDALCVNTKLRLQVIEQITHKEDIIGR